MAVVVKNEVVCEHEYNRDKKCHILNGIQSVLHCHHYASLCSQLAIDTGTTELMQSCAADAFRKMLSNYVKIHPEVNTVSKKVDIFCQYYSLIGLGKMVVKHLGDDSAEIELLSSHTDAGWKKKWGEYDKPVNYITAGFIEALLEVTLDIPVHSFHVRETASIVMGAKTSTFKAVRR